MKRQKLTVLATIAGIAAAGTAVFLLRESEPEPPPVRRPPPVEPTVLDSEPIAALRRELERLRRGGKTIVQYRAGTPAELDDYRSWIDAELRRALEGTPAQGRAPQGFQSVALAGLGELLAEEQGARRGAGAVMLRHGEARPWVIEVPHSFFDEGTLDIGIAAFALGDARALLVNTVHRHRALSQPPPEGANTDEDDTSASDVAHAEDTFFLAAHAACVEQLDGASVLQLHGYADKSAPADAVISAARSVADPVPLARALERALGIEVAVYPADIDRLGGTTNRQARFSVARGKPFVHLELSRSLRRRLSDEPEALRRFVEALFGSSR